MDSYQSISGQLSAVEAASELLTANVNYQDHLRSLMKRIYDAQQRTWDLQVGGNLVVQVDQRLCSSADE